MISVEEARDQVLTHYAPLGSEMVGLEAAHGRILRGALSARVDHPVVDVSAMDGYALRAADAAALPTTLAVIGESSAGHPFAGTVGPGQAVRIFTGAAVPAGADSIVIQENTDLGKTEVVIREGKIEAGAFVRKQGNDFTAGSVLLEGPRRLSARDIGLLAAMNHPWVPVSRRPRIAVLSSGDEVALPGDPLAPTALPSSNGPGLCALLRALGAEPINLGIVADDRDAIAAAMASVAGVDLLVTTGGASVGDYDLIGSALASRQGDAATHVEALRIAMVPGKPMVLGRMAGTPLIGLSGNPVSAMAQARLFLLPVVRHLLGLPADDATLTRTVTLGADLPANGPRRGFLRARLAGDAATPFASQDSARIADLAMADCLVVRPENAPPIKAGARVDALLFPWDV